jgi:hypothetical protein
VGGEKLEGTLREALRYAEYKAKLFQFSWSFLKAFFI